MDEPVMIRPATPAHTDQIVRLAVDAGMFSHEDSTGLREILDTMHAGTFTPGFELHYACDAPDTQPTGAVFFGPDMMTDRKWDLLMIVVDPSRQGSGIGSELIRFTEQRVRDEGGRLLLIDTSSLPQYDPTRAFYNKHGFREVAEIPDFYADGDSKRTYWKRIAATAE